MRKKFCTSVTLARDDSFAGRVSLHEGTLLDGDSLAHRVTCARRHFRTVTNLHKTYLMFPASIESVTKKLKTKIYNRLSNIKFRNLNSKNYFQKQKQLEG